MNIEEKLKENVEELSYHIADIDYAIKSHGVDVPEGTPLSDYSVKVNQVYKAGQKSMVDESKVIPKTVTGKRYVYVDDVSEIPHDIEISVSSDCAVMVYGKNLLNPVFDKRLFVSVAIGSAISNDASGYSTVVNVAPNTTYTISGVCTGMNGNTLRIAYTEHYPDVGVITVGAREQMVASVYKTFTFTTPSNCNYVLLMTGTSTVYDYTNNELQLELGNATAYEPYIEPKEYITQNGTATVKSISPFMTIIADSDVDITMNYRKSYGIQTEYDRFWDAYQENGNRTRYRTAFNGVGWNNESFKPKYDIIPSANTTYSFYEGFARCSISGDLTEILKECGVVLDTSKATRIDFCFDEAKYITRIPEISTISASTVPYIFRNCTALVQIDKLILKDDGSQTFSSAFSNCTSLQNITIEGTIGNNFDIHWSPLTHDSIMSIINHLQTKTSGTFTLTLGSTNLAKLTDAEKAIATGKGWTLA